MCQVVLMAYVMVASAARMPPVSDGRQVLMLQGDLDGATVAGVVAFFAAEWDVRAVCRRGIALDGPEHLSQLIQTCLQCPWLVRCAPTRSRQDRRATRVREPDPVPDYVIYRSDGACRGQGGHSGTVAGWGSAVWQATPDGRGVGPPHAAARGLLGEDATNNVAEYTGLLQCMTRATRIADLYVVFEVDSMLVASQMAQYQPWACRADSLLELHSRCSDLGAALTIRGVRWSCRHIYREFNQTADALSNQAIDEAWSNGPSAFW